MENISNPQVKCRELIKALARSVRFEAVGCSCWCCTCGQVSLMNLCWAYHQSRECIKIRPLGWHCTLLAMGHGPCPTNMGSTVMKGHVCYGGITEHRDQLRVVGGSWGNTVQYKNQYDRHRGIMGAPFFMMIITYFIVLDLCMSRVEFTPSKQAGTCRIAY